MSGDVGKKAAGSDFRLNVVLFSGGSGTSTITDALLRHSQVSLTIIINAYDDGHSTGRLRRFVPGMLGPSDVRKNINRMMPRTDQRHQALRVLSDYRLAVGCSFEEGMRLSLGITEQREQEVLPERLQPQFESLSVRQARIFRRYFEKFYHYAVKEAERGNRFDFTDCALGNILFAGCFLDEECDFNRAVRASSEFFEIEGRILNVTQGENLFLAARTEEGDFIRGEADLVSRENSSRIRDLFLVEEAIYRNYVEPDAAQSNAELERYMREGNRIPEINPEAKAAIEKASLIIYGPGTQHSSLLPSYLTRGVAEAIMANRDSDKVFISNIRRDVDIQQEDANELAQKLVRAMSRNGEVQLAWNDVVTHFFFQGREESGTEAPGYVPFDKTTFEFPLTAVSVRDWESHDGRHAGGYVMREIRSLVQNRIGTSIESSPDMVSIIVPALNEEKTVEEVLHALTALDFHHFELGKEIILVDGGSTDRTYEIAGKVAGVKAFQLPKGVYGRGAALRLGIEKSRGDIVIFFAADMEYAETDLYNVVFSMVRNQFKVVFGTRTVKCRDLSAHLMTIYGGKRLPYLVSKYGGMLLSTATLFLYNRYVTDVLTSIKGFDGKTLRGLNLKSKGMDLDTEIVAKVCRRGEYILEIPVEYKARTKEQGKKTTTRQGLKALFGLLVWRFFN